MLYYESEDFEKYIEDIIQQGFEKNYGKIDPYNNTIIESISDYKDFILECDIEDFLSIKGEINPYNGETIDSFSKYRELKAYYLKEDFEEMQKNEEACRKLEYEQAMQDAIGKRNPYNNKIIQNQEDYDEYLSLHRKASEQLLKENLKQKINEANKQINSNDITNDIDTGFFNEEYKFNLLSFIGYFALHCFSGFFVAWWLILIMYFVFFTILQKTSLNINSASVSMLITTIIYLFAVGIFTYNSDKNEFIYNKNRKYEQTINIVKSKYVSNIENIKNNYDEKYSTFLSDYEKMSNELESIYLLKEKDLEREYIKKHNELNNKEQELTNLSISNDKIFESKQKELDHTKAYIDKLLNESSQRYPWLSNLYSELFYSIDKNTANELKHKKRPAIKASDAVSEIAYEKKQLLKQNKMFEHQILYLESLFPWLEDFKEVNPYEAYDSIVSVDEQETARDEYETLKKWLSPEEYQKLSNTEKYQLALDRYKKRKKSDWEIGIEFERYIGYLYETKGYTVKYHGALMGLEDMGRDLIVEKDSEILIIQCKRWAKTKTIHEKHIFQLYGSVIVESIQNPNKNYKGLFITTTSLSELASKCAKELGIKVKENVAFEDYPLIKCNISKYGEKIYHLPFDQQYDRVNITPSTGESYAYTIEEAEANGFRRAYRWHSGN